TTEERVVGNKSYYDALNIAPAIGSIEIPKIKAELPIFHGTSEDVLSRGVGHLENSSLPTGDPGSHSVFTAHRGLPSSKLFRNLDELTEGDEFYLQVLDETYTYQVFDVETGLPHETDWLKINDDEEIVTLLTCEPYMVNTHRMLVKGKRIPNNETQEDEARPVNAVANDSQKVDKSLWFIYVIVGILSLLFILWF